MRTVKTRITCSFNGHTYVIYAGETSVPIDLAHEGALKWVNEHYSHFRQESNRQWHGHAMFGRSSFGCYGIDEVRVDMWEYEDGKATFGLMGGNTPLDEYGLPDVGPAYEKDEEFVDTLNKHINDAAERAGGTEDIDILNI